MCSWLLCYAREMEGGDACCKDRPLLWVELCPQNVYVEFLISRASECDLNWVCIEVIKLKPGRQGEALPNSVCPASKEKIVIQGLARLQSEFKASLGNLTRFCL